MTAEEVSGRRRRVVSVSSTSMSRCIMAHRFVSGWAGAVGRQRLVADSLIVFCINTPGLAGNTSLAVRFHRLRGLPGK